MARTRIILKAEDPKKLSDVVGQIKELVNLLGMKMRGPIPLPRKRLRITTRRTPCGDGSDTYEHWEKRISCRLIDIEGEEKYMKQVLRIKIPSEVLVKISLS